MSHVNGCPAQLWGSEYLEHNCELVAGHEGDHVEHFDHMSDDPHISGVLEDRTLAVVTWHLLTPEAS